MRISDWSSDVCSSDLVGSLLGAVFWYHVGLRVGSDRLKSWAARHGRWLTVTPDDIDDACAWFGRHGGKAVFLGRLVPAVRTFISVPAGVAGMPLVPFLDRKSTRLNSSH